MKHIFLNLKRFDIPKQMGGVNSIADIDNWGAYIVKNTEEKLQTYKKDQVDFTIFFPELHILEANACLLYTSSGRDSFSISYWKIREGSRGCKSCLFSRK